MSTRFSVSSRFVLAAIGVVLLGGLPAGPAAAAGLSPGSPPPGSQALGASGGVASPYPGSAGPAQGDLVVRVDPSTLRAEPVAQGTRGRLRAGVTITATGTVAGTAEGTTTAIVHAPCAAATSNPPGAFADTFRFTGAFHGEVLGSPTTAAVEYAGLTRPGGDVSAALVLHGDVTVLAAVRARVGATGTYRGLVIESGRLG